MQQLRNDDNIEFSQLTDRQDSSTSVMEELEVEEGEPPDYNNNNNHDHLQINMDERSGWRRQCSGFKWLWSSLLCILLLIVLLLGLLIIERRYATLEDKQGNQIPSRPKQLAAHLSLNNKTWNTESILLDIISADEIRKHLQHYSSVPHVAGSNEDYNQALYTQEKMKEAGIPEVKIEQFSVLLNTPQKRVVEIVFPENKRFKASLQEAPVAEDSTSSHADAVPTFNGFSASGDVTAELVYANYGTEEDFQLLEASGVNVSGKIVIVRYGHIFRGNKAFHAQKRGAVGCLIYSDPQDDGFVKGDVYPKGPWRPETGVQRGSVWIGNGDPTTPGWPSTEHGPRLSLEEASDASSPFMEGYDPLPTIPVQPLSWSDAYPLLSGLENHVIPLPEWQGGLNFTYQVGPGPVQVHLQLEMEFSVTPIWNVIGKIEGTEKDRLVILGNHRDAWGFGAGDPSSGSAVLLEVARALGQSLQEGWRPQRTILLCSWDAEEYGLIGSVEFVERHLNVLKQQAVAYLNVDIAVSGAEIFRAEGTPQLKDVLKQITDKVSINDKISRVTDVWPSLEFPPLGSGSDFTGFLQEVGMGAVDLRFEQRNDQGYAGVYHSNYDSFNWMKKFGDPTFEFHAALGRIWGLLALKIADEPILPFNYTAYALFLKSLVDAIPQPGDADQQTGSELAKAIDYLRNSTLGLLAAAQGIEQEIRSVDTRNPYKLRALNDRMMLVERTFLEERGTVGRKMLKHVLYAPSPSDSYTGAGLPSINDALQKKQWASARFEMLRTAQMVEAASELLRGKF